MSESGAKGALSVAGASNRDLDCNDESADCAKDSTPSSRAMVEKITDTWISTPKKLFSAAREACLVHIYPTGPTMGCRYPLSDQVVVLGRGDDCHIKLIDHSVSRKHARIEPRNEGYYVSDQN